MKLGQYIARPFTINAIRLTEENFDEVLAWCGGKSESETVEGQYTKRFYIRVDVKRPLGDRQTKAYVGDWVLKAKGGFKVYDDEAFGRSFVAKRKSGEQVVNMTIVNHAPLDSPRVENVPDPSKDSPRVQVDEDGTDSPPVQV